MQKVYLPEKSIATLLQIRKLLLSLTGSANENKHFNNDLERIKKFVLILWENYEIEVDDVYFDECLTELNSETQLLT